MRLIRDIFELCDDYVRCTLIQRGETPPDITKFTAGVELEIEAIIEHRTSLLAKQGVSVHADGSLRNGGHEYIIGPAHIAQLMELFRFTHENLRYNKAEAFSPRTSIHVHVNMLHSTEAQVKKLMYLYLIFEELFFIFAGNARKNNIHCVPLSMTTMTNVYHLPIQELTSRWHKYTAFNIIPLQTLGTIEFRHLYGTNETEIYDQWILLIKKLWDFAHDPIQLMLSRDEINLKYLSMIRDSLVTSQFCECCVESPKDFVLENNLLDFKINAMKGNM